MSFGAKFALIVASLFLLGAGTGGAASAGSPEAVLDYLVTPAVVASDLDTLDGQVRAAIVVGEAGPVGVSTSADSAVAAHFGSLRVILPLPEPSPLLQAVSALTVPYLLTVRRRARAGRVQAKNRTASCLD